jgi:beta-galactosidase
LADESLAARFEAYVADGGHLLVGPRTGYKLPDNRIQPDLAPGPFADLVGGHVDQHETVPEMMSTRLTYRGEEYDFQTWAEWLTAERAQSTGKYIKGAGTGRSAILERSTDGGSVAYCGVWPAKKLADALVTDLLDRAGVSYADRFPETVRVAERDGRVWVLNFGGDPITVDVPDKAAWDIGGASIPGYGVGVVEAGMCDVSLQ